MADLLRLNNGNITKSDFPTFDINSLSDVTINNPSSNHVLRFNGISWVNQSLNDIYVQQNQEVMFSKLYVGDGTTTSDKYIYMNIGSEPISLSPGFRFKIDDPILKTGHLEFTNDGENWVALGQSDFVTDSQEFFNIDNNTNVEILLPATVDSTANRVVTVYCKNTLGEYELYPIIQDYEGIGFSVIILPDKTIVTNTTGFTKDIKVIIQYITNSFNENTSDIMNINGMQTLWKRGNEVSTNQSSYYPMYTGSLFSNFNKHESVLYIGLVELVTAGSGNCRIEITDGTNIVIKELGSISNTIAKYTNIKLDVSSLKGNLDKWNISIYGRATGGAYILRRVIIKSKPKNVACEDYITERNINLTTAATSYYTLDTFSFYGGYKITPDSYFYLVFDYELLDDAVNADILIESRSGLATNTGYKTITTTSNIGEIRVQAPATIENVLTITFKAKVTTGSIKIKTCHIYLEM